MPQKKLTGNQYKALQLRYEKGLSNLQIVQEFDKNPSLRTVENWFYQASIKLGAGNKRGSLMVAYRELLKNAVVETT